MYIEPNSIVKILHGVPLDNRYEHTLCWDHYGNNAKTVQRNYFDNADRIKYTLTKQTYQRYDRGYIKVAIPVDNLYNCNYMMFQNTSYGSKWFYAFITNVSYVNGNNQTGTTLIEYEIDRMQTWYFDYELMQCFVEREHSATDEVGDNIVDEGLNTGDYYYKLQKEFKYDDYYYLITYYPNNDTIIYNIDGEKARVVNLADVISWGSGVSQFSFIRKNNKDIYSGAGLKIAIDCASSDESPINATTGMNCVRYFLSHLRTANCEIVSIQIVPKTAIQSNIVAGYYLYSADIIHLQAGGVACFVRSPVLPTVSYTYRLTRENKFTNGTDEYTPKNKKLLTAPYLGVEVRSSQNDNVQLDYKFSNNFQSGILDFDVTTITSPYYTVSITPKNFNGQDVNYNYSISLDKFPFISFNTDSYQQWLAQNRGAIATRLIATGIKAVGMVAAAKTGGASTIAANVLSEQLSNSSEIWKTKRVSEERAKGQTKQAAIQGGASIASSILGTIGDISSAKNMRDSYTDNANNPELAHFHENDYIQIYQMGIFPQIARIIDSYFTRFGYATKMTKVPNRNVRTHFCYTKTVGCEIKGEMPQSERDVICNVYDRGITFWKYAADIGNYDIDNPPV